MAWSINKEYKELEAPFKEYHDLKTTTETIKALLKDGTPAWLSHPEDYKAFAQESNLADKELSNEMVEEYKMTDQ